mgnify:CR=1 FL=1
MDKRPNLHGRLQRRNQETNKGGGEKKEKGSRGESWGL